MLSVTRDGPTSSAPGHRSVTDLAADLAGLGRESWSLDLAVAENDIVVTGREGTAVGDARRRGWRASPPVQVVWLGWAGVSGGGIAPLDLCGSGGLGSPRDRAKRGDAGGDNGERRFFPPPPPPPPSPWARR